MGQAGRLCGLPASQGPRRHPLRARPRPSGQLCWWVCAAPGRPSLPHARQLERSLLGWFASGRPWTVSGSAHFAQLFALGFLLLLRCELFASGEATNTSANCLQSAASLFASLNSIFLKSMVLKVLVKSSSFFFLYCFWGLFGEDLCLSQGHKDFHLYALSQGGRFRRWDKRRAVVQ